MKTIYEDTQIDLVLSGLKANNRKQILQELSAAIGPHVNYSSQVLYQILADKEDHCSSGIGDGVAVPNLQLKQLQKPFTAIAVLDKPIDYGANDEKLVDVICMILSPEKDGALHLRRLSRISRMLKDRSLYRKIRDAKDEDVIRSLFTSPEGWLLAA